MAFVLPEDSMRTGLIIPVCKESFFNTKQKPRETICAYDRLYHPPDYNPRATRSDRLAPYLIRNNIWQQELHKKISSTTQLMYGRPHWPILDLRNSKNCKIVEKIERDGTHMSQIMDWVVGLKDGKAICVDQ